MGWSISRCFQQADHISKQIAVCGLFLPASVLIITWRGREILAQFTRMADSDKKNGTLSTNEFIRSGSLSHCVTTKAFKSKVCLSNLNLANICRKIQRLLSTVKMPIMQLGFAKYRIYFHRSQLKKFGNIVFSKYWYSIMEMGLTLILFRFWTTWVQKPRFKNSVNKSAEFINNKKQACEYEHV